MWKNDKSIQYPAPGFEPTTKAPFTLHYKLVILRWNACRPLREIFAFLYLVVYASKSRETNFTLNLGSERCSRFHKNQNYYNLVNLAIFSTKIMNAWRKFSVGLPKLFLANKMT